eukprot:IDg18417t1
MAPFVQYTRALLPCRRGEMRCKLDLAAAESMTYCMYAAHARARLLTTSLDTDRKERFCATWPYREKADWQAGRLAGWQPSSPAGLLVRMRANHARRV